MDHMFKDPLSQCTTCFSYLGDLQKECCIRSCVHFSDKLYIHQPNCGCSPHSANLSACENGPSRQNACPHIRSTASLPELLDFRYDEQGKRYVVSRVGIPVRSVFGPFVGSVNSKNSPLANNTSCGAQTKCERSLNSPDERYNWMKFVRPTGKSLERNLISFSYKNSLYFAVIKEIHVGDELRVEYSHQSLSANQEPASTHMSDSVTDASGVGNVEAPPVRNGNLLHQRERNTNRKSKISPSNLRSLKRKPVLPESISVDQDQMARAFPEETNSEMMERADDSSSDIDPEISGTFLADFDKSLLPVVEVTDKSEGKPQQPASISMKKKRAKRRSAAEMEAVRRSKRKKSAPALDCPCCPLHFTKRCFYREHIKVHNVDGKYSCRVCGNSYPTTHRVRAHVDTVHPTTSYSCDVCQHMYKTKQGLQLHMRGHSGYKCKCDRCDMEFERRDHLTRHVKRFHDKTLPETKAKARDLRFESSFYKCRECKLGFQLRETLISHLEHYHPEVAYPSIPELNLPYKKTTTYQCRICKKISWTEDVIRKHVEDQHKDQVGTEDQQDFISSNTEVVKRSAYVCEVCEAPFFGGKPFLIHIRGKHPDYARILKMSEEDEGS